MIDERIIAERIANVVNKKITLLDRRLSELENKLKRLELDLNSLRMQTIESIMRSMLTIKMEDLASAMISKFTIDLNKPLEHMKTNVETILESINEQSSKLDKLPNKVSEVLKDMISSIEIKPEVHVDTKNIEAKLKELAQRIHSIEKIVVNLSNTVEHFNKAIYNLGDSIAELTNVIGRLQSLENKIEKISSDIDYVKDVSSILEERLKEIRPEVEEEEEM